MVVIHLQLVDIWIIARNTKIGFFLFNGTHSLDIGWVGVIRPVCQTKIDHSIRKNSRSIPS